MTEVIREDAVRVGVDLAKRVIQVHAVDQSGRVVIARALSREKFLSWCAQLPPGCVVAMETCRYIPGRSLPKGSSGRMRAVKERLRVSPEGEMLTTLPVKVSPLLNSTASPG